MVDSLMTGLLCPNGASVFMTWYILDPSRSVQEHPAILEVR